MSDSDSMPRTLVARPTPVAVARKVVVTATDGVLPDGGVPRGPRQLHHELIQQIFAIGLSLRFATTLSTEPAVLRRLDQIGTELDATIQLVRVDAARFDR